MEQGKGAKSDPPDQERLSLLRSRPYQRELLEKAKKGNTIVYLGTGSGKTFIAIMLIKEMRNQLRDKKAIFLVNSVALVDQQAEAIRICTGLSVGSYCGADGVDSWPKERWTKEIANHQVLVLVHQVFLDILAHSYFSLSHAALLILDECHHAQVKKDHPYSSIMREWYHKLKGEGQEMPKVLGLSACLVVKSVMPEKFHTEKNSLEQIMDCKAETTDDLYEILQYVTNPDEQVIVYDAFKTSEFSDNILSLIDKAVAELEKLNAEEKLVLKRTVENPNRRQASLLDLKKDMKLFKNDILGNISSGIQSLGLISLKLMIEGMKEKIRRQELRSDSVYYNIITRKQMVQVTKICLKEIESVASQVGYSFGKGNLATLKYLSSEKVLKLTDQLKMSYFDASIEKRAIVFVEQKFTAEALCSILEEFSQLDPSLKHIKSDFAYSPGSNLNCKDPRQRELINLERKKLRKTLARFKDGRINTIVSTSVIEEGLDVRSCNLVIKFDFPQTFRSYVQSKGRARAKPSQYILMMSEKDQVLRTKKYQEFQAVEELSLRECHYKRDTEDDLLAGLGVSSSSGYRVTCHMPHKTPITAPVRSPICPGKKQAKREAALEICRLLHEYGELDNDLKVKKREVLNEDEDDEDDDEYNPNQRKMGTRKKRNFYEKEKQEEMKCNNDGPFYLHMVEISLERPEPNFKYAQYRPQQDESSLGILTSSILPQLGPFELYPPSGKHSATVAYCKPVSLTSDEMRLVNLFHQYIFSTVLKITNMMDLEGNDLLMVPLNNDQLDYHILNKYSEQSSPKKCRITQEYDQKVIFPTYKRKKENYFIEEVIHFMTIKSRIPGEDLTFREYFSEKYGKDLQDEKQPLLRISSADKRSYMLLPNIKPKQKSKKDVYNTTLFVPELMAEEQISAGLWKQAQMLPFILHRSVSLLSARNLLTNLQYKVPEDQLVLPDFSTQDTHNSFAQLLARNENKCTRTPSVGNLLQALTLRAANDCFDMERLEVLGDAYLKFSTGIFLYYKSLELGADRVDEGELTTKRSKVVGNRNLFKIAQNIQLHQKIVDAQMEPHTTWKAPGFGRLELDQRLIDLDSKFEEYLHGEKRSTLSVGSLLSWLTEEDLEKINDKTDEEVLSKAAERCMENKPAGIKLKSFQLLSDKSLADCVEALIGIFLLTSGQAGALQFMARIGINLSADNSTDNLLQREPSQATQFQHFQPQSDAFTDDHVRLSILQNTTCSLYEKLDVNKIESTIGYKFKEKSFLLEAFTHASYDDNRVTGSYERLEYLGDAVLDYLITAYIYSHTAASPGKITDMRSALVNNNMFASIIVKNKLHPFILHYTPMLQNKIQSYIEDMEDDTEERTKDGMISDEEEINRSLRLINEVEPPELEMVEVPKVLGDVFESLIGAVYLDSGHDLAKVWEIYCRLCPQLKHVLENPPVNMKKQLLEKFPSKVTFFSQACSGPKVSMIARVSVGSKNYEFKGLGLNKALATLAACKLALRRLE